MGQMAMGIGSGAVSGASMGATLGGGNPYAIAAGAVIGAVMGALGSTGHGNSSNAANLKFSYSSWGQFIPVLYGTARIPGQIIWAGALTENNSPKGKGGGGKGGGKKDSKGKGNQQPFYSISFAMAFCEGPGVTINRMWADGNLIYDMSNQGAVANNPYWNVQIFGGTETQNCPVLIQEWVQTYIPTAPLAAPRFCGLAYVFFNQINVTPYGNRIPNITAECTRQPSPGLPGVVIPPIAIGSLSAGLTATQGSDASGNPSQYFAVDFLTQKVYAASTDGGGSGGLRVIDIATNTEIRQISTAYKPIAVGCLQGGGGVYTTGNDGSIHRFDPNSLVETNSTAITFPTFLGVPQDTLIISAGMAVSSVTFKGGFQHEVAMIMAGYNVIIFYDGDGATQLPPTSPVSSGFDLALPASAAVICNGAINSDGTADFWSAAIDAKVAQTLYFTRYHCFDNVSITYTLGVPTGYSETLGCDVHTTGFIVPSQVNASCTDLTPSGMCYDLTDNTLIVSVSGYLFKVDPNSLTVIWSITQGVSAGLNMCQDIVSDGTFGYWTGSGTTFNLISSVDGSLLSSASISTPGTWGITAGQIYDSISQSIVCGDSGNNGFDRIYLGRNTNGEYNLSTIMEDVCARANLTTGQYDTTELTGNITGYVVTRMTSGKDVVASLQQAFFFDTFESDNKIKFVPRGQAPVATINTIDLAEMSGKGDSGDYWVHTRSQEQELPMQVNVKFMDQNNAYQDNVGYSKRNVSPVLTMRSTHKETLDLSIITDITTAQNIASQWLYTVWTERDSYATSVGWQYLYLDPSDNVTVDVSNAETHTVRIMSTELGGNYNIKLAMVGEDIDTYNPYAAIGMSATAGGYIQKIPTLTQGLLIFMDTPLLQDKDDTGGNGTRVYYGIGPYSSNYIAGAVFQSTDNQTYNDWAFIGQKLTWGSTVNTLGMPASLYATDKVNTLTVILTNIADAMTTLSQSDFMAGINAAIVGNEIIWFQNIALNADGSYTMSNLIRGVRGTDWAVGTHAPGERFIFIDLAAIQNTIEPTGQIGTTQYFKLVSLGGTLDHAITQTEVFSGNDLICYSPVNFERAMAGSDLVVTFDRRTRSGGALLPGTGVVPLSEGQEEYDAYVLSAPYDQVAENWKTPGSFVRSFLLLTSPTFTYTAAEMATDSFVPASSTLYIVVFQKSTVMGHGYPGFASLPPA